MSVIAKFYVSGLGTEEGLGPYDNGPKYRVRLSPVSSGSKENADFFKWTPSGEVVLVSRSKEFVDGFRASKEWYVTFERVERAAAPKDAALFKVANIENESNDTERLYKVELRGESHGPLADAWGSEAKMGTINERAARDFLGFGHFVLRFTPAPPPAPEPA